MEKNDGFDMISETPFGNSMTTDFAIAAIEGEKLGDDEYTDVLTISYSSTDYIGHNFGVFSLETEDTYLRLDLEIKRLLDYLDNKMGKNNYSLFLTADHGALEVPAYLNSKGVKAASVNKYKFSKNCPLSIKGAPVVDYKNIRLLKKYISENGKILPSRITNVSQKKQRELSLSIKRARNLALI